MESQLGRQKAYWMVRKKAMTMVVCLELRKEMKSVEWLEKCLEERKGMMKEGRLVEMMVDY